MAMPMAPSQNKISLTSRGIVFYPQPVNIVNVRFKEFAGLILAMELKLREIYQDGCALHRQDAIVDYVNVEIRRRCWRPYWDRVVCDVDVAPVAAPAFVVMRLYRDIGANIKFNEYYTYYYDGARWHVVAMPNNYSWYSLHA